MDNEGVHSAWEYYRSSQQDAVQIKWERVIAASDGSVERNCETMGAGKVVGLGPQPVESISFPVGGPHASFRAEAAGLDRLLDLVAQDQPLLILTDCLTMLTILLRWGRLDSWQDPEDIKHIDVLGSCLRKLRCRSGPTAAHPPRQGQESQWPSHK